MKLLNSRFRTNKVSYFVAQPMVNLQNTLRQDMMVVMDIGAFLRELDNFMEMWFLNCQDMKPPYPKALTTNCVWIMIFMSCSQGFTEATDCPLCDTELWSRRTPGPIQQGCSYILTEMSEYPRRRTAMLSCQDLAYRRIASLFYFFYLFRSFWCHLIIEKISVVSNIWFPRFKNIQIHHISKAPH